MTRPGVMLVEDNPAVARQLQALLAKEFDITGWVDNGLSMLGVARTTRPDVIVTDISLPGMDGMAAAEILCRERPELRIVFITVHTDTSLVERALSLGECGYVLKADAGEDLLAAVHGVLAGSAYLSRSIAGHEGRLTRG
ncbi:MAG TPA: response regulator transcription factor [Pseudoxanthomonas sp.]|nr:response regulator transcription factor [Pseudoxanthomonas sp.]